MTLTRVRPFHLVAAAALLGLLLLLAPFSAAQAGGEPQPDDKAQLAPAAQASCSGYYYTVRLGDTWNNISRRVGVTVAALKAANPKAVRPRDLIYAGERICIPSGGGGVQQGGYWYQVRPGDTWNTVARATGVPVRRLWEANPRLLNARMWLYIGQRVWIPGLPPGVTPTATPTATATATVPPTATPVTPTATATATTAPTETATTEPTATATTAPTSAPTETPTAVPTATATELPTETPTAVPTATATEPPTETPTAAPTATTPPTATATEAPTETPTETPTATATTVVVAAVTPTATEFVSPLATPTQPPATATTAPTATPTAFVSPLQPPPSPVASPTVSPTPLPPIPSDCPQTLEAYGETLAAFLNKEAGGTPGIMREWLILCRAVHPEELGVVAAPITAARSAEVVVAIDDPTGEEPYTRGLLLIYHEGAQGYALAHQVEGQGRMELIEVSDVNADRKPDIVYTDTSCGAHTCFGTLGVLSWDGKAYQDWITGTPTIAEPDVTVKEAATEGQGREIVMHGGVINSVGAGPQRAWTETYISPKGGAYVLHSQVYDPSACLYHKIVDANRAFDAWALDGFEPAIEAYKAAIADTQAEACGEITDEVATLRDFARFRLLVASVAAGRASEALPVGLEITTPAMRGATTAFLNSYRSTTSVIQACRDTTKYAEENPPTWQFLADWGYANPSFTAQDLCPLN